LRGGARRGQDRRVRHLVASIAFGLCLAACSAAPVPHYDTFDAPVHAGEEFRLAVGEHVQIGDSNLFLWFESVPEDSRCPKNVTCVWEGNARARFRLRDNGHDEYVELNTSSRFEQRRRIAIGALVLRNVDPQPPVEDPKPYVVTLFIEPAQ
jgi:hypothetical protein